jgi:hypothetical protein
VAGGEGKASVAVINLLPESFRIFAMRLPT